MSGMGDGYVGTAQDAVRIHRLQKQREAERREIEELKSKTASGQEQSGLLQFGSSSCEILVDMVRVPDWAFEPSGQEMTSMGQDAAATYHPGLYLTPP